MATYLFTWNATKEELHWAVDEEKKFRDNINLKFRWACGNTKKINVGDKALFLKQSLEPKGILGFGTILSQPYESKHWSTDKEGSLYVDISWQYFSSTPIINRSELASETYNNVFWDPRRSGVSIDEEVAGIVLDECLKRIECASVYVTEEIIEEHIPEGAKKTITINAYERSLEARKRCLVHYGYNCFVCGNNLARIYGEVADKFIHVHHIIPLSTIQKNYMIDPIKDLRPVCPNCHSIIHKRVPAYTIEEVKNLLLKSGKQ